MQMFSYNNKKSGTFWELLAECFVSAGKSVKYENPCDVDLTSSGHSFF